MHIVVIGSGIGGLGVALRLQAQGHDVTIVEQRDTPGGRASPVEQDGFTFDAGPTMVTAPWLIADLFAAAGVRMSDYVKLVSLDPLYAVRFEDGSVFHATTDHDRLIREIRRFNPADVSGYLRFRRTADRFFDAGFPLIDRPPTRFADRLRANSTLVRLRADRSLATLVNTTIRDPRLQRVFSLYSFAIGGTPFRTTSLHALIHSVEQRWGIWFILGGVGALVRALARVYADRGGTLRLSAAVTGIMVDDRTRRVTGVQLASGDALSAASVVSSGDIASTYLGLVPPRARRVETDRRIQHRSYSASQVVLSFGTDRQYDQFAHHEIFMGARDRVWLDDLIAQTQRPSDFPLYLHRPTATDPTLAPVGCDTWTVMSPVPNLGAEADWEHSARPYRDAIVRYLESRYLPDLSRHIVTERWLDPRYFRDSLNCHLGSCASIEPTFRQSLWNRPQNRSADVENLYCVGAGTYPGAGLPAVIASGKIVAQMIGVA